MANEWKQTNLGSLLSFANGKTSPDRKEKVHAVYAEISKLAGIYKSLYSPIERTIAQNPLVNEGLQIGFSVQIIQENFEERFFALVHQGRRGTFCGVEEGQKRLRRMIREADFSTPEVVDIFAAAGLQKPDISILSDEFLTEIRQLPQQNLALELLKKLINDEIKTRMRKNVVRARSFADMLEQAVRKYQNRATLAVSMGTRALAIQWSMIT